MEILINAHGAGFTQGFAKLSCRKRPGKHMLTREVLTVTWWGSLQLSLCLFFHSLCPALGPLALPMPISVDRLLPERSLAEWAWGGV